jgi:hypothetical protein
MVARCASSKRPTRCEIAPVKANIDSRPIQDTMDFVARRMNITKEQAIGQVALSNFLKVPATVKDTANTAVLIASDRARMMTGTVVNASAGAALD